MNRLLRVSHQHQHKEQSLFCSRLEVPELEGPTSKGHE